MSNRGQRAAWAAYKRRHRKTESGKAATKRMNARYYYSEKGRAMWARILEARKAWRRLGRERIAS